MIPRGLKRRLALWLAGALLSAAALVALSRADVPGVAGPPRAPRTIPFTDVGSFGANVFLEREADGWARRKTAQLAAGAHLKWAKQQFPWYELEPESGRFEFDKYDAIVNLLRSHGLEVIARLDFPPDWVPKASWVDPEQPAGEANFPPADNALYARYAGHVAEHFRGRVRFYQVWNEPNLLGEWGFNPSHPVTPTEYAALLGAAAKAIRGADPDAVVLSAPLAYTTESTGLRGNMSDVTFLDGLYRAGADDEFDVLSANAFGFEQPPAAPPSATVLNFRRVELQREVMVAHGDASTPVWINEYGWNAAPADLPGADFPWQRVSPEDQATFTVDGVRWANQHWPWAGPLNIWFLRRERTLEGPDRFFALVDPDFTQHRAYAAVRAAAAEAEIATPGVWEERSAPVRPVEPEAETCTDPDCVAWRWGFAVHDGTLDGNVLASAQTGAELVLRFVGAGVGVRIWSDSQAGAFEAQVDGERRLTPEGSPTWVLTSASPGWRVVDVVSGLGTGIHELRLTVGRAGGQVVIDRFEIAASAENADPSRPWRWLSGALVFAFLVLAFADVRRIGRRLAASA